MWQICNDKASPTTSTIIYELELHFRRQIASFFRVEASVAGMA